MSFRLSNEACGRTIGLLIEKSWMVVGACDQGHALTWYVSYLEARFPREATLEDIAARLKCATCDLRDGLIALRQDNGAAQRRDLERFEASGKTPGVGSTSPPSGSSGPRSVSIQTCDVTRTS